MGVSQALPWHSLHKRVKRLQASRDLGEGPRWPLDPSFPARASEAWPQEPVRSLDAIHLAPALVARGAIPDLRMLSLDQRVREKAAASGFPLLPA